MKKKLITVFAACSMLATAFAGMVQTAYAATPTVRIGVADGNTDTQKVLTLYYEGSDAMISITGQLTFTGGDVTIDSLSVTIPNDSAQADKNNGSLYFSSYEDYGTSSTDGSFATATITVPTDVDITASFKINDYTDIDLTSEEWGEYGNTLGTVTATIPAKTAPTEAPTEAPDPVNIVKQDKIITGTGEYASQKADIYGVEVTPVDQKAITGAKVTFDGQAPQEYKTGTTITSGSIIFAVILVSESGAELPELNDANVTPIYAE